MNQFRDILSKRNKKCTKKGKKGYNIFLQGFLLRCTDAKKKGNILEKKFLTDARTSQNIFAFSLLSEHSKQYFFLFCLPIPWQTCPSWIQVSFMTCSPKTAIWNKNKYRNALYTFDIHANNNGLSQLRIKRAKDGCHFRTFWQKIMIEGAFNNGFAHRPINYGFALIVNIVNFPFKH